MAYTGAGRRPFERASKSAHHHIINDPQVQQLIEHCWLPPRASDVEVGDRIIMHEQTPVENPIEFIVAVDGGYGETVVRPEYPSSVVCFMQFGALLFSKADLDTLEDVPHPAPEDMERLKRLERLKLALPVRNMRLEDASSLTESVRRAIYGFFCSAQIEEVSLIDTLAWLVFERFREGAESRVDWNLATNPHSTGGGQVVLRPSSMRPDYTFSCSETGRPIFLTDVLRLHERVDEEQGAGGILGYLTNAVEQLIIVHLLRMLLQQDPQALRRVLLIKDGPLGFFGQTANLHRPTRELVRYLVQRYDVNLIGVEKSGAFVDHAAEIQRRLDPGAALILTNDYIYRYILPGPADPGRPYGANTNYGHKIIFKTRDGQLHVVSVPSVEIKSNPTANDLINLQTALSCVDALHCSMYDSALFPIALANKLVSLAAHPSQRILQRFAVGAVRDAP